MQLFVYDFNQLLKKETSKPAPAPEPTPSTPIPDPIPAPSPTPTENGNSLVTKEQLLQFGWVDVTNSDVTELNRVLAKYEINTSLRISFFLGNVKKESGSFARTLEKFDLDSANGINTPEDYFNRKYCTVNGNMLDGDGQLFRGAGFIQLTGRGNYQAFADSLKDAEAEEVIMSQGYVAIGGTYIKGWENTAGSDSLHTAMTVGPYAWEAAAWFWRYGAYSKNGERLDLNTCADSKDWYEAASGINRKEEYETKKSRNKYINEFYQIYTRSPLGLPQ